MRFTTGLVALGTCVPAAALIGMSAIATADTRPEAYILHMRSDERRGPG